MVYLVTPFKRFSDFRGRSSRKAYWMFTFINLALSFVLGFLGGMIGFDSLSLLFSLVMLVPGIALAVRRMHDVGKSGWFGLVPFYNLYLSVQPSEPRPNAWGPVPGETE